MAPMNVDEQQEGQISVIDLSSISAELGPRELTCATRSLNRQTVSSEAPQNYGFNRRELSRRFART
jgi:hypothetical protein